MTKVAEILNELRQNTPIEKIRQKYRSQSQLYEAIRIYLSETEQKIEETQSKLTSLSSRVTELEKQNSSLKTENDELTDTKDKMQRDISDLEEERDEKLGELDTIKRELSELEISGITSQIVARIHKMELESGDDLLERVATATQYKELKEELAEMTQAQIKAQQEVVELQQKKKYLTNDVSSQKNLLDEAKTKTATFQKAIRITFSFFSDGYDTEDLMRLKDGLQLLSVKGNPELSIDRLVRGLEKAKTLSNLKNSIKKNEKKLETLNAKIIGIKGELETYVETVLKLLDEARTKAIKQIDETGRQTASTIEEVRVKSERSLSYSSRIAEKNLKSINQMITEGSSTISKSIDSIAKTFDLHIADTLSKFNNHVSDTMKVFRADLEKAQRLTMEAAVYGEMMKHAYCLLGVLKIPDAIREVPLDLIAQLADRIHTYIEICFGNETTRPSKTVCNRERAFFEFRSYKLPALSFWLKEELEKRSLEKRRNRY